MKLIRRTYRLSLLWLLPVLLLGNIFVFFMINYVVYEETDEFLIYEMNRLVSFHREYNDLPDFHMVSDILEDVDYPEPVFKDTLLLESGDNEMVPYRELYFTIDHRGKKVTLVLRHLLVGEDDILRGTLLIVAGLALLVAITFLLMIKQVSGKIWKPFYQTLKTIRGFKINEPVPALPVTGIDEFNTLNTTVEGFLKKISTDYKRTKEFNENASHELQTHLAVIRANAEFLLNEPEAEKPDEKHLQAIYNATVKLSQTQKSLLLLSKIGNQEFNNPVALDLGEVLKQSLQLFRDAAELRDISVRQDIGKCTLQMDPGLADVMVNNLVKNSVKHNVKGGYISILLESSSLTIENSGHSHEGEPETLLERFKTGTKGNLGIGLAIVKQICDLYKFDILYRIEKENVHFIKVSFPKA